MQKISLSPGKKHLFFLAFALLAAFAFTGCASQKDLYGTWVYHGSTPPASYTISETSITAQSSDEGEGIFNITGWERFSNKQTQGPLNKTVYPNGFMLKGTGTGTYAGTSNIAVFMHTSKDGIIHVISPDGDPLKASLMTGRLMTK